MDATINTSASERAADVHPLALIRHELTNVDRLLATELRSDVGYVNQLLEYIGGLGGKRLRPALLLLSGMAVGQLTAEHRKLAAVVEMIHTATLVHDDILDDAHTRRHGDTVNRRWDTQSAVLSGDFLFTHAFYLSSTLPTPFASRVIGRATNRVCEGELRQAGDRGNLELSTDEYLEIINAKTAELCACCCLLGAHYADGSSDDVNRLEQYGRSLGIAFQITDDVLDLEGCETVTGKSLGTDLEKQKLTLPLIYLLSVLSPRDQQRTRNLLTSGRSAKEIRNGIRPLLREHGAVDHARVLAEQYAASARHQLATLSPSPAREAMEQLAELAVARHR